MTAMRFLPRSIAGRTVLILVVGLSLSHAFSVVFHQHDRYMLLAATGGSEFAHRVAAAAAVLHLVSGELRPAVATASQGTDLHMRLGTAPTVALPGADDWRAGYVRRLMLDGLPPDMDTGLVAVGLTEEDGQAHLHTAMPLRDGVWLHAQGTLRPSEGPAPLSMDMILSTLIMFVAVLLGSLWAARTLTRPLSDLSAAADRLGRDVTAPPLPETGPEEVRRAAEAFNRMQGRLRRFVEDRMQMLAAISHDLRTPITVLRLRAEFIEDDQERARTLRTLEEMAEMVDSVLAFAREEADQEPARAVDLGALVDSVCADLADAGLAVECADLPGVSITCRASALRRAVANLASNAARHGGGARVSLEISGRQVLIHVDDDGPGIPEDDMEAVFRPFHRLEKSRHRDTGGVGLGLSVVRTVAHAHGGEAVLANRPGGGLRATLALPLEGPQAGPVG